VSLDANFCSDILDTLAWEPLARESMNSRTIMRLILFVLLDDESGFVIKFI